MLRRLYRTLVPRIVREPIWLYRKYRCSLSSNSPQAAVQSRGHLCEFYQSIGRHRVIAELNDNTRMRVDLRDRNIGRLLFIDGCYYEVAETAFISNYLSSGMTFVDVGANLGVYSVLGAKRVGPTGRVIAFEPDPDNFSLLIENLQLNRCGRQVTALNLALGEEPGELTLWKSAFNFGDHRLGNWADGRKGTAVRVDSFDNQFDKIGGPIHLLKIDVQGFEAQVFNGMKRTLRNNPPHTILMEYWPHGIQATGHDPEVFLRSFGDAGYQYGLVKADGGIESISFTDIQSHIPPLTVESPDSAYVNLILTRCDSQFSTSYTEVTTGAS